MPDRIEQIDVGGARFTVEMTGDGPSAVLLHPGVANRRCWSEVAPFLEPAATVITYDRRGHGDTPPSVEPFSHAADLAGLLRALDRGPALLVGSSMGGGVALDVALMEPELVSALLLVAPSVSGEPEVPDSEVDDATLRLDGAIAEALKNDDPEFANRLEAWLWLDGPSGPEGRVGDPARPLLLEMNAIVFGHGGAVEDGDSELAAWSRLGDVTQQATVSWGDLDIPAIIDSCETIAGRIPGAATHVFPGTAHLPYMEQPEAFANVVLEALARGQAS